MISDKLKQKLSGGQALRGTFVKLNCPAAVEILGYAGLDFVIIDGEHAPCDQIMLENLVRAGDCVGLPVIVRVPTADDIHILKAMDVGAAGVQIPGIETVAQAEDVVKAAKYAPMGRRGLSFAQRSACYGFMDKAEYLSRSNENGVTVVHIENREMAEQAEALCKIPEIDVLFIGPMDLSQSYGKPGQPSAPEVQEAIRHVIVTAAEHHKPTGIFVGTREAAERYERLGVRYIVLGSDASLLLQGARASFPH